MSLIDINVDELIYLIPISIICILVVSILSAFSINPPKFLKAKEQFEGSRVFIFVSVLASAAVFVICLQAMVESLKFNA